MPAWIIGPGLLIPPVFVPLFLCAMPTPVPPSIPAPSIDRIEADHHLQATSERLARYELTRQDQILIESWKALQREELLQRGRGKASPERLSKAQTALRTTCNQLWRFAGTDGLLTVGDSIALTLTQAVVNLEVRPTESMRTATEMGGGFLWRARASGLIDSRGRLTTHPIVPFSIAQAVFRSSCGLRDEVDMEPIELDGIDVYRITFGTKLSIKARLGSLDRYSKRYEEYPAGRVRAFIFLRAGKATEAFDALQREALSEPRSVALRNHLLFAQMFGE